MLSDLTCFFLNTHEKHTLPAMNIVCWGYQQRSLCSGIFAESVQGDGTRLEVTPLEAPWRNGKTERAGEDWKEHHYKTTQDGPEAQTWTDFAEDCDAVNQSVKNQRQRIQCLSACFLRKPTHRWRMPFWNAGE